MTFCKRCGRYAADAASVCPQCGADLRAAGHESVPGKFAEPIVSDEGLAVTGAMFGSSMEPAGHVQRFVSLLIDLLIAGLLGIAGVGALVFVGGILGVLIVLAIALVGLVYEPYFIAVKGATPGKSMADLCVVNKAGGPVSVGQSVVRWLAKFLLSGFVIPFFVPFFTSKRRALHDMIAGTYVVRI